MDNDATYEQIFSESIPKSETIIFESLLPKYRKLKAIEWGIFFGILLIGAIAAYIFIDEIPSWIFILFISLYVLTLNFVYLSIYRGFRHKGFAIREKDVHYKTGWITRSITTVPMSRIQHMKVQQSAIEKLMNLAKLNIYTAGDSSNDMTIRGISFEKAQQLKALLSGKIEENDQD
ncbi:hypothetical protein C7377_0515 [Balneicella halophila]|uniref:YdbS-like PH domain-containing protein n=1 Tax=Balneicella halophila TaxID=1537566 RepID=A0A7L4UR05_BALHA|nr:PH domain-containing protein [Balneicella halophila]PVX52208.1 hypothetical protein C7377_0515 [Balneicella halophila]